MERRVAGAAMAGCSWASSQEKEDKDDFDSNDELASQKFMKDLWLDATCVSWE